MGVTVEELSKGDGILLTFKFGGPLQLLLLLLAVNISDISAMAPVSDRILKYRPFFIAAPPLSRHLHIT